MNKYQLTEQARDSLKEAIEYKIENEGYEPEELDQDDIDLHELADSLTPIYNSDLLELCQSDMGTFGYNERGEAVESVIDIISWNCFEFLVEWLAMIFDDTLADVVLELEG